jgi:hypothetical protein
MLMRCAAVLTCLVLVFGFGTVLAGDLEPSAPPGPTMKSLNEIAPTWSQTLDSTDGEPDGCNSSRFKCVLNDEAVLDMETGLVWQRSPDNFGVHHWAQQFVTCWSAITGGRMGWRMPTVEEYLSLVVPRPPYSMGLPEVHPFVDFLGLTEYYSATTDVTNPANAMWFGCSEVNGAGGCGLGTQLKTTAYRTWCVRGGSGDVAP